MATNQPRAHARGPICDATWSTLTGSGCSDDRAVYGELFGRPGIVEVCSTHDLALGEYQRGQANQDGRRFALSPPHWARANENSFPVEADNGGADPDAVDDLKRRALNTFISRHLTLQASYPNLWEHETEALISEHGLDAVEAHLHTIFNGERSTTMLANIPTSDQVAVADLARQVVLQHRQRTAG